MPLRSLSGEALKSDSQFSSQEPSLVPRLLVSVRNVEEAVVALEAGVDLLDVKEPNAGPLGAASPETLRQVGNLKKDYLHIPFSAALGELCEHEASTQDYLCNSNRFSFVKLGLAGLAAESEWQTRNRTVHHAYTGENLANNLQWVSVAYADFKTCHAPEPSQILEDAISTGSAGFLIDTYSKTGMSTFDFMSLEQLTELKMRCRANNLFLALAGSIKAEHLSDLISLQPDIIAVRGAVCGDSNRKSKIEGSLITAFKEQIKSSFTIPKPVV